MPVAVGVLYLVLSTPFLLNLAVPSMHEGSVYAFLYVFLNLPIIYLLGGFIETVANALFKRPSLYQANVVFITISWFFWVALSRLVGSFVDFTRKQRASENRVRNRSF